MFPVVIVVMPEDRNWSVFVPKGAESPLIMVPLEKSAIMAARRYVQRTYRPKPLGICGCDITTHLGQPFVAVHLMPDEAAALNNLGQWQTDVQANLPEDIRGFLAQIQAAYWH